MTSIGRITKGMLLDLAETVDVIEPIAKFTAKLEGHPGVGIISNVGLEDWRPPADGSLQYGLIWVQWCSCNLGDDQLVGFLQRCQTALSRGEEAMPEGGEAKTSNGKAGAAAEKKTRQPGVIVLKENISSTEEDVFDESDSSVIR